MKTIWKYPVPVIDEFTLKMPAGAKLLTVQAQGLNDVCVWALVDDQEPRVSRRFLLRGTGHNCDDPRITKRSHVGTFQVHGGALVFHLFEEA